MYIRLHVKYPLLLSDFTETTILRHIFQKRSNIKFNENPSSGSRVVPCGRTDGQAGVTKLIVALQNFAKAAKNIGQDYTAQIRPVITTRLAKTSGKQANKY